MPSCVSNAVSDAETLVELSAIIRALHDLMPGGHSHPWSLSEISDIAGLDPADILAAIHPRLPRHGTHMQRWDALGALLSSAALTPPGGWTATALSELAGIPLDAISDLTTRAIRNIRASLATQGIHNRRDIFSAL